MKKDQGSKPDRMQQVQPGPHKMKEKGAVQMGEITVINYINVDGKDVLFESLPEEKRRRIAEAIQDRMMERAGYRRKPA